MNPESSLQERVTCPECDGARCSWECEPCMHGESCGSKCIDDLCRGSEVHYDCERCGGTGYVSEDDIDQEPHDEPFGGGDYRWRT